VRVLIVIPARLGSTRLPGKPLRLLRGEPLITCVTERVLRFGLDADVVVATDDHRVADAVAHLGVRGVPTSSTHRSGTERVAEVLGAAEFATVSVVLNVQGDQPFLPKAAAEEALQQVVSGFQVGTVGVPLSVGDQGNRNRVKVAVDRANRALAFSRRPLAADDGTVLQHLGLYAYTPEAVRAWVSLPQGARERSESLEQLRPLEHGMSIGVARLECPAPLAIDTEEDLRRAHWCDIEKAHIDRMSA
jgi:3-deoxy-manno-octulosonate cytidylyltransferase (CMP-KDO synthetase)